MMLGLLSTSLVFICIGIQLKHNQLSMRSKCIVNMLEHCRRLREFVIGIRDQNGIARFRDQ